MFREGIVWLVLLAAPAGLLAQEARLSGAVVDPTGSVIPGAELTLYSVSRQGTRTTTSQNSGVFLFPFLQPGDYRLEVAKEGFAKLTIDLIRLRTRDRRTLRIELELATLATSIDVVEEAEGLSEDTSSGTSLDHEFVKFLPLQGRNAESLVLTAPGVTSANGSELNVNGLRSNTNYYTLDGVSLNARMSVGGGPGGGPPARRGGGRPGAQGEAEREFVPMDALREVSVQTSTFAPEFGRTPGAQVAMSSRGGTNEFHGSLFEYFGNDSLNANQWFANASGLPRAKMRFNQFGGTLGGPVISNRSFFFASYEGLRFREPDTALTSVPDLEARNTAPSELRPFLDAFPVPNGLQLDDQAAQFNSTFSNPSSRDSFGFRVDHTLDSHNTMFVRYSVTPTEGEFRGGGAFAAPSVITARDSTAQSITGSLISSPHFNVTNDLRVNYTASRTTSGSSMDSFGGAVPLTDALVFPAGVDASTGAFSLNVAGLSGYSYERLSSNTQRQLNIVNGLTLVDGVHQVKIGADLRLLAPTIENKPYSQNIFFRGLSPEDEDDGSLLSGSALNAVVSSFEPQVEPLLINFSAYIQDTVKASPRTHITFGVRWDVNPAPGVRGGERPLALCDPDIAPCAVTQLESIYDTRWTDLAPRFGFTHQFEDDPGREVVFRFGAGVFRDLGYGSTTGAFNGAPYANVRTLTSPEFPLISDETEPPGLPATRPFGQISASRRDLRSPIVNHLNATIEKSLGVGQILSVGYAASRGRRLLRVTGARSGGEDFDVLRLATNGASSDYHGLQIQFRRRRANFTTQLGYTYSHAIDTASDDSAASFGFATLFSNERGSSDFDIRHNLNFSGSYLLPAAQPKLLRKAFSNWWTDWVVVARTGLPIDLRGISDTPDDVEDDDTGVTNPLAGLFAQVRPDYNGLPVWLDDPAAPGGRRLNPDAFEAPEGFRHGSLGRNAITGFPMAQVNLSLRRQIQVGESMSLSLLVQAFNIFNQPNFANPSPFEGANLASPNFGVATRALSDLGSAGAGSSLRNGGPRTMQLGLRFQF